MSQLDQILHLKKCDGHAIIVDEREVLFGIQETCSFWHKNPAPVEACGLQSASVAVHFFLWTSLASTRGPPRSEAGQCAKPANAEPIPAHGCG